MKEKSGKKRKLKENKGKHPKIQMNTTESWTPAFATYTSYSLRLGHAAVDRAEVDRAVDLALTRGRFGSSYSVCHGYSYSLGFGHSYSLCSHPVAVQVIGIITIIRIMT